MSKFKVGDKVVSKVTEGRYSKGDTGTVTKRSNSTVVMVKWDDPRGMARNYGNMSDAEERNLDPYTESELERLVRVANEGCAAIEQIRLKYRTEVEAACEGERFTSLTVRPMAMNMVFRVKPKPAFKPFTVGSGWNVELKGETLHIGCQQYVASQLKKCFDHYARKKERSQSSAYPGFRLTRDGIFDPDAGHAISWTDADKILAALEKAGIK